MDVLLNRVSAIVMLSGFSARYSYTNKLLLPFGEKKLCEHILELASSLPFLEVIVTYQDPAVKEVLTKFSNVLFNKDARDGVASSIKLGVQNTSPCSCGYLFLSGDRPFLEKKHIISIVNSYQKSKIVVPFFNNQSSSPCLFDKSFKRELLSLKAHEVGKQIIHKYPDSIIRVDFTGYGGVDINTEEEYLTALKIYLGED